MKKLLERLGDWHRLLAVLGITLAVLVGAFLVFNNLTVSYARRWDIDWGYYAILSTFILLIVGVAINMPMIVRNFRAFKPSGRSICAFAGIALVFSIFMFGNISNTHRVLSDETSWESMGLQMYFVHTGGICNEGIWKDGVLDCKTEVNNFKGKALGFVYSLVFNFMEPGRDTALLVNYPFYLLSLLFFFFALSKWFKDEWAALAATAFLGGMPIYLLQARSASTEVLYIFLLAVLMAWYAFVPASKVNWKHFLLTVPLLGFFAQTRQETVFAFIPFALYYYKYFFEKAHRLPLFVAAVIAVSWPSVNTMAAYRGYDFQGGEHAAHSLENFWFNLKTNIEVMLNLDKDPSFGGIMQSDGTLLHHVGRHEVGLTDGGNDDVGLAALLLQRLRARVADGNSRIAVLLLHHQLGHRLADDVGAAEYDALLAACLDAVALQQRDDAKRRSRDEAGQTDGHAAHVDGMEAVNVLTVVDGLDNLLLVDVLRQGQLDDETVDVAILVQTVNAGQQFLLGHIGLIAYECRLEATGLAREYLILNVCLRAAVVTHQHCGQVGLLAALSHYLLHFLGNLGLDGSCRCFSVNQLHNYYYIFGIPPFIFFIALAI